MKVLGLKLNAKKSVLSPLKRTPYLGVVWDFDQDAGTYVLTEVRRVKEGQVTHSQAVLETARSDYICVQRNTYWPAVYETPTVVAQDQGVLPWKITSPDQGHAAVPMCLRHEEEALVLVYGSIRPIKRGGEARGMDASLRGGEVNLESVWPGLGVPLHYSGDSAMSPLVLSSSSNSTGVGCYGTDMAEASSVHLSPDRSAPRSSGESAPGGGQSTSSSIWILSTTTLHGRFPSGGIPSHRQGSFTPARSYRSCGCGLWGGAAHGFRSLNRGCWGHIPIQSSLNEETVRPEVETFHFMVQRPPSRPSQLPARLVQFWSSCRPVSPQDWPTPPWRFMWRQNRPTTPLLVDSR